MKQEHPMLLDYGNTPDIHCSGIARIVPMTGGLYRFVAYTEDWVDGQPQWIRAGSLILPFIAVPAVRRLTEQMLANAAAHLTGADGRLMAVQ